MTGPPTSEIAREVDRLVIGVHRAAMSLHRSRLRVMVEAIGLASPGHLYDLAEFLAVGACTVEIARHRFQYEPGDAVGVLMSVLHRRRLVDQRLRPSDALLEVVETIFQWRAEAAAGLWGTDLVRVRGGAAEALSSASGPLVEAFRSLPEPTPPAHRLHHLLTGLRYARFDAHSAAWEEAKLTAAEVVALSSAVASKPVSSVPERLTAMGWLTVDGSATAEGHAARSAIEAETNSRCDALFDAVIDRQDWLATMRSLPPRDE